VRAVAGRALLVKDRVAFGDAAMAGWQSGAVRRNVDVPARNLLGSRRAANAVGLAGPAGDDLAEEGYERGARTSLVSRLNRTDVIPAQAGIQGRHMRDQVWMPAIAGMTRVCGPLPGIGHRSRRSDAPALDRVVVVVGSDVADLQQGFAARLNIAGIVGPPGSRAPLRRRPNARAAETASGISS